MLKIAEADVNLSTNEPLLLAEYAPRYRPMNVTMIVDVVNNNIVLGNFGLNTRKYRNLKEKYTR